MGCFCLNTINKNDNCVLAVYENSNVEEEIFNQLKTSAKIMYSFQENGISITDFGILKV